MSFQAIREDKIIAKISDFTVTIGTKMEFVVSKSHILNPEPFADHHFQWAIWYINMLFIRTNNFASHEDIN